VIDPGHSPAIRGIDPVTRLDVSGYENEPEMRDVFAVAELVKAQLQAAGYRVIMTKATVDTPVLLNQIAATANNAHAALALSIHDQAGSNGGIGFNQGNNVVYYQSVGDDRVAGNGQETVFTDGKVAAVSKKYGQIFRAQRAKAESHPVTLQGDVGYDLGILTPEIFTMMVLMALVTTAMTGPLLSLSANWGRHGAVAPVSPVARSS